jgi:CheY-like chemotaxis protein/HPt (histidine-containing phosphotransfer) domain-containing protein
MISTLPSARARGSLRILLAEDNLVNQRLAVRLLDGLGHEVEVAKSGVEAVELFARSTFDLVLMDIQMPEMDGEEATRRLRAIEAGRGGRVPIVAMTAHAMKGDRERFLEAGMDEYISKPISPERLREVVRTLVSRESEARSDAAADRSEVEAARSSNVAFDGQALLARVDFDRELLGTLIAVFKADRPGLMAGIEEALSAEDAVALADSAHTMKGALSVFGVEPARSIAEQLEMAGREKRLQRARELYERLGREVASAEDGLESFLTEIS